MQADTKKTALTSATLCSIIKTNFGNFFYCCLPYKRLSIESCLDWKRNGGQSGVYFIQLPGKKGQLRVWCDMDTDNAAGWYACVYCVYCVYLTHKQLHEFVDALYMSFDL